STVHLASQLESTGRGEIRQDGAGGSVHQSPLVVLCRGSSWRSSSRHFSGEAPMRTPLCVVMLVMSASLGLSQMSAAQSSAQPAIHSVVVQPDAGVLTITGTGFGVDLIVTVDGQPVTVLPGATPTRLEVQPPATVLTA